MSDPLPDLSGWAIPRPAVVRRPERGTNNLVWILDDTYVLRVYQNLGAERVSAEHRLLAELTAAGDLPFAVPAPLPAVGGRSTVATPDGPAALFPYLPGRIGDRTSLHEIELAAEALGRVDRALAALPHELAPVDWRVPLDRIHPAVPSVDELCEELTTRLPGHVGAAWLRDNAGPTDRAYAGLLEKLPVQIMHGDFAMSNVLIDDGRVSAVLDWEIAGLDLRVNDLVAGLEQTVDWESPSRDAEVAAFRRGYDREITLDSAEEDAIPLLLRYRALGSAVWRAGRLRRGQATLEELREHLTRLARDHG